MNARLRAKSKVGNFKVSLYSYSNTLPPFGNERARGRGSQQLGNGLRIQILQKEKEQKGNGFHLKTNSSPGYNTRLLPDKHSTPSYSMARTSLRQLQDGLAVHVLLGVC